MFVHDLIIPRSEQNKSVWNAIQIRHEADFPI